MEMESELAVRINGAKDPLKEALILAIAGNIIDFGTPGKVTRESVWEIINKTEKTPLNRDQSSDLFQDLSEIKELLYLGDNCGEIVFNKLFIQELQKAYPLLNITFAVRGSAILNDITLNDAAQTGMDQIVKVISNGDNAPGTRLDHCSQEFQQAYKQADLIISKGQGNLETLDEVSDKIIYFLFITKCPMISKKYSTDLHSLMCIKNLQE
jgi:uncharacterized protein with ATP-grasp and redox domains